MTAQEIFEAWVDFMLEPIKVAYPHGIVRVEFGSIIRAAEPVPDAWIDFADSDAGRVALHAVEHGASRCTPSSTRRARPATSSSCATEDVALFKRVLAGAEPAWAGPTKVCGTCRAWLGRDELCDGSKLLAVVKPVDGGRRLFCPCCSASWPISSPEKSGPVPDHVAEVLA